MCDIYQDKLKLEQDVTGEEDAADTKSKKKDVARNLFIIQLKIYIKIICGWGKKNVKIKRTENIFFHFSPFLGEKKLKEYVGEGIIKIFENIFP